ncbi:glycosyltransferase family 25 protein [Pseudoalteromonas aurantia]|uniref:Glycosyl transferase, family 25 n=1 Tax=Pseudoalteromonas aurantia 208 TaxID=1314867 RepID=A0ABR9EGF8_9GAMM|nr:glycosyltransferase family 25 protein [Pseudoalteromonas aurantia]MBE0370076.1 glycosyl transferase, family 25 [Pseudoalteromonas aurantia 208]
MTNNTPPVFLINLDNSTDRLHESQERLAPTGLTFERVSAVYGAKISLDEKNKFYSAELNRTQYHKPLSPGEIGCYMSHLKVLQHIVDNNIKYAVILEDDFKVVADLNSAIASLSDIPFDWDMIKLAEYGNRERPTAYEFKLNDQFNLRIQQKVSAGTCAQAVSLMGAKKILNASIPFGRPVDTDYQHWWEKDIEILTLSPCPLKQDLEFDSTIAAMSKGLQFRSAFWRRKLQQMTQKLNNKKHTQRVIKKYMNLNENRA